MVISLVSKTFTKVFGSRNDRLIKAYARRVEQINELESQTTVLCDEQLRAKTAEYRQRVVDGESMESVLPEALAVAREVMDRAVGIRNIFNPAHGFDPAQLPDSLQSIYHEINEQMRSLEPVTEKGSRKPLPVWQQVQIPVEIYQAVRQLQPQSRPPYRARPFDVQLIGGMVLGEGKIAEMKTGEGKTIVAPLACYLACLEGRQCFVVTVNDYLVQRDRDWVFPFYCHLALTVGAIHPFHMQPNDQKTEAYECAVVYGTNSEFGFDYLRDNMVLSVREQVQRRRHFCIIDEVDSVLIDEARTPLIISGPAHDDAPRYGLADAIARHLMQKQKSWDAVDAKLQQCQLRAKGLEGDVRNARDKSKVPAIQEEIQKLQQQLPNLEAERDQFTQYYEIEMERKASHLTHEGVAEAQKEADIGSFYVGNNMDFPHLLENALRSHVVYKRDKDYVVREGDVVIVDEFTGRLMIGRQWSDGLHQAVESKEKVEIKQETQTLATVTIQNFFKLFERLAGMTGTAITEATEFHEIYGLDVVCIPTNVSVVRDDRDDLIFLSNNDKWNAIIDEIKLHHDVGRPVLVGTTSVEKSEALSQRLERKLGIKHEVLNAKVDQVEREANIVQHAGELGAVMIATNMAGRGTDIRLAEVERDSLIHHWQHRDLLPREGSSDMSDEALCALVRRHMAGKKLGIPRKELEALNDDEVQLLLLRDSVEKEAWIEPEKAAKMSVPQCEAMLDELPGFNLHRLKMWGSVEEMGGLHIVGTERHEARRIDNQLRGRAGRQGDQGSSRFFIALDDDLMQMFAKGWLMKALPKLGMKEGDALEHRMVTRAVERAQRKVEERNYEIRKNLLEYDEVMEYQRNTFYGLRQSVLEGAQTDQIIIDYIGDAVQDACELYLAADYLPLQVAEWCHLNLDVSVESGRIRLDSFEELQRHVRAEARAELGQTLEVTLGEYMSTDIPPEEWDLKSLSSWAMSRFSVDLKQNQLRRMNVDEVKQRLTVAAEALIDKKDLSGVAKFLDEHYAERDLAGWIEKKFGLSMEPAELARKQSEKSGDAIDRVTKLVQDRATEAYKQREIEYPINFVIDMYQQAAQHDGAWAADQLAGWANQRYELGWTPAEVGSMTVDDIGERLVEVAKSWLRGGKLEALIEQKLAEHGEDSKALDDWSKQRFGRPLEASAGSDREALRSALVENGRAMLRAELTQLERFVLLQILDVVWKDHLYAMDQLKDSVGLRGYAERDPRIEYKREGARMFTEMLKTMRDRVTELIFVARLTADVEARSVYARQQTEHADAASAGTAEQREDLDAARFAGSEQAPMRSRRARRAAASKTAEESSPAKSKSATKNRKRRSR